MKVQHIFERQLCILLICKRLTKDRIKCLSDLTCILLFFGKGVGNGPCQKVTLLIQSLLYNFSFIKTMPSGLFLVALINGEQCIPNPTIPRCSHSKRGTLLRSEKFSLSLKKEIKIILTSPIFNSCTNYNFGIFKNLNILETSREYFKYKHQLEKVPLKVN